MTSLNISETIAHLSSLQQKGRNIVGGNTHPHVERIGAAGTALYAAGTSLFGALPVVENPVISANSLLELKNDMEGISQGIDELVVGMYRSQELSTMKEFDPLSYDKVKFMIGYAMTEFVVAKVHIA